MIPAPMCTIRGASETGSTTTSWARPTGGIGGMVSGQGFEP
jgi:hypothetical protein